MELTGKGDDIGLASKALSFLSFRQLFRLALHHTEGLIGSILRLLGRDTGAPAQGGSLGTSQRIRAR
jgi:hypothetical protein